MCFIAFDTVEAYAHGQLFDIQTNKSQNEYLRSICEETLSNETRENSAERRPIENGASLPEIPMECSIEISESESSGTLNETSQEAQVNKEIFSNDSRCSLARTLYLATNTFESVQIIEASEERETSTKLLTSSVTSRNGLCLIFPFSDIYLTNETVKGSISEKIKLFSETFSALNFNVTLKENLNATEVTSFFDNLIQEEHQPDCLVVFLIARCAKNCKYRFVTRL